MPSLLVYTIIALYPRSFKNFHSIAPLKFPTFIVIAFLLPQFAVFGPCVLCRLHANTGGARTGGLRNKGWGLRNKGWARFLEVPGLGLSFGLGGGWKLGVGAGGLILESGGFFSRVLGDAPPRSPCPICM